MVIAKTTMKAAMRFFTGACDGSGLTHAPTIMAEIAGANGAASPIKLPFKAMAPISHMTHDMAKAKTKNHVTGCFLNVFATAFCPLAPLRSTF
jgi:hypothetical protein